MTLVFLVNIWLDYLVLAFQPSLAGFESCHQKGKI